MLATLTGGGGTGTADDDLHAATNEDLFAMVDKGFDVSAPTGD
jgi:hypothetical protein